MKKIIFLIIAISILAVNPLWAKEVYLTLDEAIAIAIRDNRDALLKAEDVKKAQAKINEARAQLYPSLSTTATLGRSRGYYAKDFSSLNYQVTAEQNLFKSGKMLGTIAYYEYLAGAQKAALDKTKIEIILNVKKSFYTLLLAYRFAHLNKRIVQNAKDHLKFMTQRYQHGQASESDLLNIRDDIASASQIYDSSMNQIDATQALLRNYLAVDNAVRITPRGDFRYTKEDIVYDMLLLEALKKRPEIQQYELQERAAKQNIDIAKTDTMPSITASWDYYGRDHAAASAAKNWSDSNAIGITVSWPIFDGFATKSKIEQAQIDLRAAQITREKIASDIALELRNAYILLKNALDEIQATESELKFYKNSLATTKEKYRYGMASFLDTKDALLKYAVSLFNRQQAIYDYVIAKSNIDKAIGMGGGYESE